MAVEAGHRLCQPKTARVYARLAIMLSVLLAAQVHLRTGLPSERALTGLLIERALSSQLGTCHGLLTLQRA